MWAILLLAFLAVDVIFYTQVPYNQRNKWYYTMLPGGGVAAWWKYRNK